MSTEQRSRVVLINGATGGLGPAVVSTFVEEGARLVLSTHNQPELDATAAESGPLTLIPPLPAASQRRQMRPRWSGWCRVAQERFGALDVVVQVTG
ncbi:MAG: SDR family NAD(P)-dependent oxidoreductase, partial [Chloroflexaceae bacterium]|nr:SDR family NAD(P)-dependent oxidoreductase [Chloroflexaceae bacterium]